MTTAPGLVQTRRSGEVTSTPRVLLSAYQCGPGLGSVSQLGWEWYSRLAACVPVTLITHIRNRVALEENAAPLTGLEIIYIDSEWLAGPLYRFAQRLFPKSQHAVFMLASLDFYLYDFMAIRELKQRMRHGDAWDIVHAVTPVSPIASTRLYQLGLPVVLGPWNGGLKSPKAFPEIMKSDSSWFYSIRNLGKALDCLRGGSSNAAAILTANQATRDSLPAGARSHCVDMLENGVDLKRFVPTEWPYMPGKAGPLRIVFVGRLVPFKGVAMLLNAVARLQGEIPLEVRVVGGGPMAQEWSDLTAQLALSKVVQFCGPVALSEIPQHLNWAHVFCLPSVRESGGAVLLEAMACARPVIAINYGGPATVADDTVGRLLPADGEESVIGGLMETIRDIWGHPAAWQEKGAEGRRRAHDRYEWSAKIARVLELYQQLPKSL